MKTYTGMNANVALALCLGGGFLLAQTSIFVAFRSSLTSIQIAGILAITIGMTLLAATRSTVENSSGTPSSKVVGGPSGNTQE
jgi:multidrug transporter EmrE-like cation transporter